MVEQGKFERLVLEPLEIMPDSNRVVSSYVKEKRMENTSGSTARSMKCMLAVIEAQGKGARGAGGDTPATTELNTVVGDGASGGAGGAGATDAADGSKKGKKRRRRR